MFRWKRELFKTLLAAEDSVVLAVDNCEKMFMEGAVGGLMTLVEVLGVEKQYETYKRGREEYERQTSRNGEVNI